MKHKTTTEELIKKFVKKLDYSYDYKTANERQNIINLLCEIAGINQLTIPVSSVKKYTCNKECGNTQPSIGPFSICLNCGSSIKETIVFND